MGAHDCGIEHLDQMGRTAHGGERIEESLEHAGLAQAIEALPYAVPVTEAFRQRAPSHIFDREEMKRFEKPAVVLGFASAPWKAGAKHGKRMRPVLVIHPCRHRHQSPTQSETYESSQSQGGNPVRFFCLKFVHTA